MPCGTVEGTNLEFGISDDEATLVTQSASVTKKKDKKEARDKCGNIISVTHYNETADISIEGYGSSELVLGAQLPIAGNFGTAFTGKILIDEVSISKGNEEFVKSSIKAMHYANIAP